ncbi:MAG: sulfur oxidation c-type cytochrome SoxX [Hyphomicrobiaceae bacterium]
MRSTVLIALVGLGSAAATFAFAEHGPMVNERQIQRALRLAFPNTSPDWQARLSPDTTMATCAEWHDRPPKEVAEQIKRREVARIVLPKDRKFMGDWRRGEKIAQSGYGLRFTDTDSQRPRGGNCYACHELSPDEVSYGTLGVSLKGLGRTHKHETEYARIVYEKIFNSQALIACSTMPRFGANGILTIEQIKDLVAYLLDPASPVNRPPVEPTEKAGGTGGGRRQSDQ